jgi:hypothetical protein
MTGMTSCREIRQALGVYVLGAIDPAERAQVDEHLATCPDCREELASLAGLPAMLRKVPIVEAERLAESELDADELPSEELLKSLVARTSNVRRIHRWRRVTAAAAVVVLALGGGAAAATVLEHGSAAQQVHWHESVGADPAAGIHLTVMYRRMPWGTEMRAHVTGLKPGTVCEFQLIDSSRQTWPLGSWQQAAEKTPVWYPASTWVFEPDVRSFQVTVNGKLVVSAAT